jgi:predicted O-methyltransferase YrrM
MLHRFLSYLSYFIHARNLHRVHSPFVFNLYSEHILAQREYYCFKAIEYRRTQLLADNRLLPEKDPGAGSNKPSGKLNVADVARNSLIDAHYGQLLFRLIGHFKPQIVVEFGTSLGIAASYFSKAHPAKVHTIEGRSDVAAIAKETFKKLKANNIQLHIGLFDDVLPGLLPSLHQVDFIYLDGNHQYEATMRYVKMLLPYMHDESVLIVDDIRWSKGMINAWNDLIQMEAFHVSIDLKRMGMLMKRSHQKKEHFTLYVR